MSWSHLGWIWASYQSKTSRVPWLTVQAHQCESTSAVQSGVKVGEILNHLGSLPHAGIVTGDVIINLNGIPCHSYADMKFAIGKGIAGDTVKVPLVPVLSSFFLIARLLFLSPVPRLEAQLGSNRSCRPGIIHWGGCQPKVFFPRGRAWTCSHGCFMFPSVVRRMRADVGLSAFETRLYTGTSASEELNLLSVIPKLLEQKISAVKSH